MKYSERIKQDFDTVKSLELKTAHTRYEALKSRRQGEYLIKVSRNNKWHGLGVDYIQADSFLGYGVAFGRRSDAAWFKKEELKEILDKIGKGFMVVKKSKNGY